MKKCTKCKKMNKIDYKLAKQLKDAGFPQKDAPFCVSIKEDLDENHNQIRCYQPTLLELIESCGMGFRSLSLHSDGRWIAKSGHGALPTKKLFTGKTPEEAVTKLYLKLNEK